MKTLLRAGLCLMLSACADGSDPDASRHNSPLFVTASTDFMLVLVSNFETSTVDAFHPATPDTLYRQLVLGSGDAVLTRVGGAPVLLDRGPAGVVTVFAPNLTVRKQFSIRDCGPHDIVHLGGSTALITCYDHYSPAVVDLDTGERRFPMDPLTLERPGAVDFRAWADADGIPEADHAIRVDDRVFISIQNLDRNAGFLPYHPSYVIEVPLDDDLPNAAAASTISLAPYTNPFTPWVRWGAEILVGCARFDGQGPAGILALHPDTREVRTVADKARLGGSPHELAALNPNSLVALVSGTATDNRGSEGPAPTKEMRVVRLDRDGTTHVLHRQAGYSLTGLATHAGVIYFGDRSPTASAGLWRIDDNGDLIGPLRTSLPPYDFLSPEGSEP